MYHVSAGRHRRRPMVWPWEHIGYEAKLQMLAVLCLALPRHVRMSAHD